MRIFFLPFLFLPLLEIAGFVLIGGEIGLGWTFLWLVLSAMAGIYLLQAYGSGAFRRAQAGKRDDIFVIADLFDGICLLVAGLLLVFPGFISDFLAVPFLVAPCRHWLFRRMKDDPDTVIRRYARGGETVTIIEGDFTRHDDADRLK